MSIDYNSDAAEDPPMRDRNSTRLTRSPVFVGLETVSRSKCEVPEVTFMLCNEGKKASYLASPSL